MKQNTEIKKRLLQTCKNIVEAKYDTILKIINSNQKSLEAETKSSAGDKHETGRAMMQLEMEKASKQFVSISSMQEVLQKIDINNKNEIGKLGSLIYTNLGSYFLAISIGQTIVNGMVYYIVSPFSPIGKILLGKKKGDNFLFNGKIITIKKIF